MIGYSTQREVIIQARERGLIEVLPSGLDCCPLLLPDGSWGYWGVHDCAHIDYGEQGLMVSGGRMISLLEAGFNPGEPWTLISEVEKTT